jgi:Ran GTPase-activating protein (RanGAP) involved in mRNA processing and transport
MKHYRICYNDNKLRVPYVTVAKLRTAMHHISACDVAGVDAVASIGAPCMTALDVLTCTKWLSTCEGMQELILSNMQWQKIDPAAQHLGKCLAGKSLRVLDLSNNYLADDSMQSLAEALDAASSGQRSLEVVNLNLNCVTDMGLAAILPLGSRAGGVTKWGFRHNKLGNAGCERISQALYTTHVGCHVSGTSWDLRTNKIGASGAKALLLVFQHMSIARLGCNPLGDAGAEWLSRGMGKDLVVLDLGQASIGDEGAAKISRKLMECSVLEELLLGGNEIGAGGAI